MKRNILPFIGVAALAMVAFIQPKDGGFKKVGKNLYETNSALKLSKTDQEQLLNKLKEEYSIKSFNSETTVEFKKIVDPANPKTTVSYMADKKVGAGFFNHSMLDDGEKDEVTQSGIYNKSNSPISSQNIKAILNKYN